MLLPLSCMLVMLIYVIVISVDLIAFIKEINRFNVTKPVPFSLGCGVLTATTFGSLENKHAWHSSSLATYSQENRLIIFILNAIKYTINLPKRDSIQDNTITIFAFSTRHTCFFVNCGMFPFIFASYFDLPSSSYLPTISTTSTK